MMRTDQGVAMEIMRESSSSLQALKDYIPVGHKAEAYFEAIVSAGFLEELAYLLDHYAENIDASVIQEFLDSDGEWILEQLGLPELDIADANNPEDYATYDGLYNIAHKLTFRLFHSKTVDMSILKAVESWMEERNLLPEGDWFDIYLSDSKLDEEGILDSIMDDKEFLDYCRILYEKIHDRETVVEALKRAVAPENYDEHHGLDEIMDYYNASFYLDDDDNLVPCNELVDFMLGKD